MASAGTSSTSSTRPIGDLDLSDVSPGSTAIPWTAAKARFHALGPTRAAAARRAETNITRKKQAREWDEQHGKLIDLSVFQRDILPLIQEIPLSRLQQATGLSLRYVSLIRRGERTPHPRHWPKFRSLADVPP